MPDRQNKEKIQKLAVISVLTALITVMAFTPVGYLKIGAVSITFISIPVVVGAILEGPAAGAFLGAVFGITSFLQCFGLDPFGTALFSINPFFTAIMCLIPRILMGLFCGLIFRALSRKIKKPVVSFGITSLSGGVLNTVLFVGALILLFGSSDYLRSFGENIPAIIAALVTFNALIEWAVCLVVGTAVSRALTSFMKRSHIRK